MHYFPSFLPASVMLVSHFWCHMSAHSCERRAQGHRGVWLMQHETLLWITCAGRSLQQRGGRGGKRSVAVRNHSPRCLIFSRGGYCVLPLCPRRAVYACVYVRWWWGFVRAEGPCRDLTSVVPRSGAMCWVWQPVYSVPASGFSAREDEWGGSWTRWILAKKGSHSDIGSSTAAIFNIFLFGFKKKPKETYKNRFKEYSANAY